MKNNGDETREQYEQFLQENSPKSVRVVASGDTETTVELAGKSRPVCDFCSTVSNAGEDKVYEARDITVAIGGPLGDHASRGNWGACQECAALIDADNRKGLLDRAVKCMAKVAPEMPAELIRMVVGGSHNAFFKARIQ